MTVARRLAPLHDTEGWPVINAMQAPVLRGASGDNYLCGHCAGVVLAETMPEDSFFDLVFRCPRCGKYSQAPSLPSGRVLGARTSQIALAPGLYDEAPLVEVEPGVCLLSWATAGRLRLESPARRLAPRSLVGEQDIRAPHVWKLIERATHLLGDRHQAIEATHRRAGGGRGPGMKNPHPLMQLLDEAQELARALSAGESGNLRPLVELHTLLQFVDAWADHPQAVQIVKSFADPGEYRHGLVLLAAASSLIRQGHQVELNPTRKAGQSADLRLALGDGHFLNLEVKAPSKLSASGPAFDDDATATGVLHAAFKNATKGRGGQLSPSSPGVLVVGGVSLPPKTQLALQVAAAKLLDRNRRAYVAGVLLVSINYRAATPAGPPLSEGQRVLAATDLVWVGNPHFNAPGLAGRYLPWGGTETVASAPPSATA